MPWSSRRRSTIDQRDSPPPRRRGPVRDRVELGDAELAAFESIEHRYWTRRSVVRWLHRGVVVGRIWLAVHLVQLLVVLLAGATAAAAAVVPFVSWAGIAALAVWLCHALRRRV